MKIKLRNIIFSKAANTAFHSLLNTEKKKALHLLNIVSLDLKDLLVQNKLYKLKHTTKQLYAIRLSLKLRMVIEITEDEIIVLDIINHDLFIKYFTKPT